MTCRLNSSEGGRHVDTEIADSEERDLVGALARVAEIWGICGGVYPARRARRRRGVSLEASTAAHRPVD